MLIYQHKVMECYWEQHDQPDAGQWSNSCTWMRREEEEEERS